MALFIVVKKLPVAAMAIYPFILVKNARYKQDLTLINHEKIHHKQQLELLVLPFYLVYLLNYMLNLLKYGSHHQAYANIIFEREAYQHEWDFSYLSTRKAFAYFRKISP